MPALVLQVLEQFLAMRDASWHVVDASQPIDTIQQQLREAAAAVVQRCQAGQEPLRRLWDWEELQGGCSGGAGSNDESS